MNKWVVRAKLVGLMTAWTAAAACAGPQYKIVFLDVDGYAQTQATGIAANGQITGLSTDDVNGSHALLWPAPGAHAIPLDPPAASAARATATDGTRQVGNGNIGTQTHALLWTGSASGFVDLHPDPNMTASFANAGSGSQQVGTVFPVAGQSGHAALWSGSAASVVDLNPAGALYSVGDATDGQKQGGTAYFRIGTSDVPRAYLWEGSAASATDLTPSWSPTAGIFAMIPGKQAGAAVGGAVVWHGTPQSAVSFAPTNLIGYSGSSINAMAGDYEAGYGSGLLTDLHHHAMLWHDSPDTAVDLHAFLPSTYLASEALGVDANGDVVGWATAGTNQDRAVLWILVPEPSMALVGASDIGLLLSRRRHRPVS